MRKISFILLFVAAFYLCCSPIIVRTLQAATYYVEHDAGGGGVGSIGDPWTAAEAMTNAVAGDLVYFRAGTYDVGDTVIFTTPALNPSNSGSAGSPITFKAYFEEIPIMKVSDDCTNCQAPIGSNGHDYITWDGFTVDMSTGNIKWKGIIFYNADYCEARGCIFIGTTRTTNDNVEGIRIEDSSYSLAHRCEIYDFRETGDNHNTSAMKFYNSPNTTVEYCEIRNCSNGIYVKSGTTNDNLIARYNYIHSSELGIYGTNDSDNSEIYHNVFRANTYGILFDMSGATIDNLQVYNNTIYSSGGTEGIHLEQGSGWDVYNNIISGITTKNLIFGETSWTLDTCDHNQFGDGGFSIITDWNNGNTTYTTLAGWHTSSELAANTDWGYVGPAFDDCGSSDDPGCGSLVSDPLFQNGSSEMNQLDDFRLQQSSPCKGAGRNDADMGANIDRVGLRGAVRDFVTSNLVSGFALSGGGGAN